MKRNNVLLVSFFFTVSLVAQHFKPIDEGSNIRFSIKNFGIATGGTFNGLQGDIVFDPANLSGSRFDISVDANTINTSINARDNHLRKEEYFDVKKHPTLRFISTKMTSSSTKGEFMIFGRMTIKGTTKEISFPFTAKPQGGGYLFTGSFMLNRRDFKVGKGSLVVSDNLTVSVAVFGRKVNNEVVIFSKKPLYLNNSPD